MAISHIMYSAGAAFSAFNKEVDLAAGDAIKYSLHTSTYTPSQAHNYADDRTNELAASGNYSTGGATCTNGAVTVGSQIIKFDADDAIWANLTVSSAARYAIGYADTAGAASTDPLITYVDFGADQTVASATLTIQWSVNGIFQITCT